MKRRLSLVVILFVLLGAALEAQVKRIAIPAGTLEDKALQVITAEPDAERRIALTHEFLEKFSSNSDAVAFGNWQLAQAFQAAGQNEKALAFGEKALAASPNNLEILVSLCGIADGMKDTEKVLEYAVRGGTAYGSIASAAKPSAMSAEDWANEVSREQASYKQSYEYLEAAAYNAINVEPNAKKRLQLVEQFTPAFPKSRFEEPISQLAMASMQELNDRPQAITFGEKMLKQNPDSVPTLLLLANTYIEDPKTLDKAITLAAKAVKLSPVDESAQATKLAAGMARSTYGYALLSADKSLAAVPELKQAVDLLDGNDPVKAEALYRLGFAYAKLGKRPEAKAALEKCLAISGPYESFAKELLYKVNAPAPKRR